MVNLLVREIVRAQLPRTPAKLPQVLMSTDRTTRRRRGAPVENLYDCETKNRCIAAMSQNQPCAIAIRSPE
jgi:hypothetical protein